MSNPHIDQKLAELCESDEIVRALMAEYPHAIHKIAIAGARAEVARQMARLAEEAKS